MKSLHSINRRRFSALVGAAAGLTANIVLPQIPAHATGQRTLSDRPFIAYYYANSKRYFASEISQTTDKQLLSYPGLGTIYFRLPWVALQPNRGPIDWSLLKEPCDRFSALGFKLAFRVSCSENRATWPHATPKWVFDLGAKSRAHISRDNGPNGTPVVLQDPIFDDPIFLQHHRDFLHRLNDFLGNYGSLVSFVDVGSFGVYGEGHTVSSTNSSYKADVLIDHIRMAYEALPDRTLLVNHNFADNSTGGRDFSSLEYAASLGMGFRDDSIFVDPNRPFYDSAISSRLFKSRTVVLETAEVAGAINSGRWNDDVYLDAIAQYGATDLGIHWYPSMFYKNKMSLVERVLCQATMNC